MLLPLDIAGAWLDTLLDVIDLLPKEIIKKDVSSGAEMPKVQCLRFSP